MSLSLKIEPGSLLPETDFVTSEGDRHSLSEYLKDDNLLLCVISTIEDQRIVQLLERLRDNLKLFYAKSCRIVVIAAADESKLNRFKRSHNLGFTIGCWQNSSGAIEYERCRCSCDRNDNDAVDVVCASMILARKGGEIVEVDCPEKVTNETHLPDLKRILRTVMTELR
jgi:peroxiredoxin